VTGAALVGEGIASLSARAAKLRRIARYGAIAGVALIGVALAVSWPDPAGRDLFDTFVAVPSPLARFLLAHGAGVQTDTPAWLLDNGSWQARRIALGIPIFLFAAILIAKLIPSIVARIALFMTSPLWLGMVLGPLLHDPRPPMPSAETGIIVDHEGAPPARADGDMRHPPVPAFHLDPVRLPPRLADQAQYVLAQQAYLDDAPARASAHLRGLSGAWGDPDAHARVRLGILARWVGEHGYSAGAVAESYRGAAPNPLLRRIMAIATGVLAVLLLIGGVAIDIIGAWRARRAKTLAARCSAPLPAAVQDLEPASAPSFGRKRSPMPVSAEP
jgi:hypothetical protein